MTRYRTIVADPPWRYSATSEAKPAPGRSSKMVEGHYATMSVEEIAALPVKGMVDKSAHLYLWVTNPRLYGNNRDSGGRSLTPHDIVEAWGFTYVTLLTWIKTGAPGQGWYYRGATEHAIFAVRDKCSIPAHLRRPNYFMAPRGRHSEKPDCFYDMVEELSPAPRLEMFARRARLPGWGVDGQGWDYWGDESLGTAEMAS